MDSQRKRIQNFLQDQPCKQNTVGEIRYDTATNTGSQSTPRRPLGALLRIIKVNVDNYWWVPVIAHRAGSAAPTTRQRPQQC